MVAREKGRFQPRGSWLNQPVRSPAPLRLWRGHPHRPRTTVAARVHLSRACRAHSQTSDLVAHHACHQQTSCPRQARMRDEASIYINQSLSVVSAAVRGERAGYCCLFPMYTIKTDIFYNIEIFANITRGFKKGRVRGAAPRTRPFKNGILRVSWGEKGRARGIPRESHFFRIIIIPRARPFFPAEYSQNPIFNRA